MIASPEDRATPWAGDAFVRNDRRFPGFVLMHAATAGGIWNGLPIGIVEMIDRDRSAAGNLWISRVFVNGVMTEGIAERASTEVLRQAADADSRIVDPYSGVLADGTSPIPVDQIEGYRASMVDHAMEVDRGALTYSPLSDSGERERERVRIGEQLSRFMRFCGSVVGNTPRAYWGYIRAAFARMLGRRLQGDDGMLLVDDDLRGLDSQDTSLAASIGRIHDEQARIDVELRQPVPRFAVRSTPVLWSSIREMVFGSLDGSGNLEKRGFALVEGRTPVFGRVADVIHDPFDTWSPPVELRSRTMPAAVAPLDWSAHDEVRERLDLERAECAELAAQLRARIDELDSESARLRARGEELESALLDSATLIVNKAGDIVPAKRQGDPEPRSAELLAEYRAITPKQRLNDRRRAEVDDHVAALAARTARLEQVDRGFTIWQERHGSNFGAHVIKRVAAEQAAAARHAESLRNEVTTLEIPEPGTLRRLRDQYFTRTAVLWGVVLAVATILIVPISTSDPDVLPTWWPEWWWTVAVALGALVVVGFVLLSTYYRQWSAFNRAVIETEVRINSLNERALHARREEYRLGTLLEQARAWLDLLASALRRPWKVGDDDAEREHDGPDPDDLPFAMRIARALGADADSSRKLHRGVAEALVRRGWRAAVFGDLLESIRDTQSLDDHAIDLDALDKDLPHLPNQSRTILRENMDRDDVLESVARRLRRALESRVEFEALYGSTTHVRPFSNDPLAEFQPSDADAEPLAWDRFLTAALGESDDITTPLTPLAITPFRLQQGHHQDVRSFVVTPKRLAREMHLENWHSLQLREYDDRSSSRFDVVVRVDLAGPVPADAVRLGLGRADFVGTYDREFLATLDTADAPRCPRCGRTTCQAADPTSGLECEFSGV